MEGGQRHVADILPDRKTVSDREREMDTAPDAAHAVLNGRPARRLEEANKLLEEVSNMLGDVRRELLGSGNRAQ